MDLTAWLYSQDGIFDENGKEQRNVFLIEPPRPIKMRAYSCGHHFETELIEDLFETYDDYGIVHIKGEETTLYSLNGDQLTYLTKFTTQIQSNHSRGGQSQNRIERLRQEQITEYLKKINELLVAKWIIPQTDQETELIKIKGLIIVGHGLKKDQLLRDNLLDQRLSKILLGVITSDTINITNLQSLVYQDQIKTNKDLWDSSVGKYLIENPDRLIFGKKILPELRDGIIQQIFLSQTLIDKKEGTEGYQGLQEMINLHQTNLIIIPSYDPLINDIDLYGGLIGIRWY